MSGRGAGARPSEIGGVAGPSGARGATVAREVSFPTTSPFTLQEAMGGAPRIEGVGQLFLPEAAGAGLPAVVILEGLGGMIPERELRYGSFLAEHGYAALAVNTFRSRHAADVSDVRRALTVTSAMMQADAYAALRFLSDHPLVAPARIAVIGFSYGGMVSVLAAYEQLRRVFAPDGARFAAHVSYYGCSITRLRDPLTTGAPVQMSIGGLDRNVSVERSRAIADDLRRGGSTVDLRFYPDAYHQWDGADRARRFFRFSLRPFELVLEPDNRVRDPRTGLRIRGQASRAVTITANLDWRGYHMLRDEGVLARSDAALLAFLHDATRSETRSGRRAQGDG